MDEPDLNLLEKKCSEFLQNELKENDPAHDLAHTKRVVANTKLLLKTESADAEIVLVASWLHDCVTLPKNHPDRKKTSTLAAEKAVKFLQEIRFPEEKKEQTAHAIQAHSYSAGIDPETKEAKLVQDADRLDALGAIGIARCFMVGGQLGRPVYNPDDPFCKTRTPDDSAWTTDHFYKKLFSLQKNMNTESARREAEKRTRYMKEFLEKLGEEIGPLSQD